MSAGIVAQILNWLRAGYPEGVPPKDYSPLLALLRRGLSREEFDAVIAEIEAADHDPVRVRHIREAIARVSDSAPDEEELRAVAAHLAEKGWPLSERAYGLVVGEPRPDVSPIDGTPVSDGPVQKALRWLRAGYPAGVPATDQVPLLALLRNRLSEEEVRRVAEALAAEEGPETDPASPDAQERMAALLGGAPSEEDVERVRRRLTDSCWEQA